MTQITFQQVLDAVSSYDEGYGSESADRSLAKHIHEALLASTDGR